MTMTLILLMAGVALAASHPAAAPLATVEDAVAQYCEPLMAGASAASISETARSAGFHDDSVDGNPVLIHGELILGLSDTPRVCFVQAPAEMTLTQGFALVDAWAAHQPGAVRGAATTGPDGAPVRVWAVPNKGNYLLATQQTGAEGRNVMNFIMAPLPAN